ncbi:hypothetical protein GCK72_017504 [Caenorhabditis remanei]|uniref:Uncharacterized protein n=1 Tax=Caenorhabditis remanei TaxID=31234 RepID=A0A6A5G894_CAERE|nr:hypothetical protein GCK72_017504 [Caenorhabditis remanei]KAF1750953.1 hypothetical protein GCK72_017504 [Caenorhabditis remanei]
MLESPHQKNLPARALISRRECKLFGKLFRSDSYVEDGIDFGEGVNVASEYLPVTSQRILLGNGKPTENVAAFSLRRVLSQEIVLLVPFLHLTMGKLLLARSCNIHQQACSFFLEILLRTAFDDVLPNEEDFPYRRDGIWKS